jgi:hypothetical protein
VTETAAGLEEDDEVRAERGLQGEEVEQREREMSSWLLE